MDENFCVFAIILSIDSVMFLRFFWGVRVYFSYHDCVFWNIFFFSFTMAQKCNIEKENAYILHTAKSNISSVHCSIVQVRNYLRKAEIESIHANQMNSAKCNVI